MKLMFPRAVSPLVRRRALNVALLVAILIYLSSLLLAFAPALGSHRLPDWDYGFYYDIARHVTEGHGLTTSLSLFYSGLHPLPTPTRVAPLWPLLLGHTGKLIGLADAAALLPRALYLLDLVLLYELSRRVARRFVAENTTSAPNLGHLTVSLFGLHWWFILSASAPYTEPLAIGLVLGAVLLVDLTCRTSSTGLRMVFAFTSGVFASLGFLTRQQLVLAPVAACGAATLVTRGRQRLVALSAAVIGVCAVVIPCLNGPHVRQVYHSTIQAFSSHPPVSKMLDRLDGMAVFSVGFRGLLAAFDPGSHQSYVSSFGLAALLVPLACLVSIARPWTGSKRFESPSSSNGAFAGCWMLGIAALIPIHLAHIPTAWGEMTWMFHTRHGLPFVLVLLPCMAYLLNARHRAVRWAAATLVAISILGTARQSTSQAHAGETMVGQDWLEVRKASVSWLNSRRSVPTIVAWYPQLLVLDGRIKAHYFACHESPRETARLFSYFGAEYLVWQEDIAACPSLAQVRHELHPVASFAMPRARLTIYRYSPARLGDGSGGPPAPNATAPKP